MLLLPSAADDMLIDSILPSSNAPTWTSNHGTGRWGGGESWRGRGSERRCQKRGEGVMLGCVSGLVQMYMKGR